MRESKLAWAIAFKDTEYKNFAAIYNFISHTETCQDGCRIAIFATRRAARAALAASANLKGSVVRVNVKIIQIGKAGK
ncbi:MAG: hypothetical protein WC637_12290 [Victivallales bacterium]